VIPLNEIQGLLAHSFQRLSLIESNQQALERYSDSGVIIFSFYHNNSRRVIKYYTLENISYEKVRERIDIINKEYDLARRVERYPHFVRVYRHDKIKYHNKYIGIVMQMEYFELTLNNYLKSKAGFTQSEVTDFLQQMSDALEMMHHGIARPFVHLDIKPANIGIRRLADNKLQYVLMDFDVSADLVTDGNGRKHIDFSGNTSSGYTPGYAAPEQVQRFAKGCGEVSFQADIFSVGRVALDMIYRNNNPHSVSLSVQQMLNGLSGSHKATFFALCNEQPEKRPYRIRQVLKQGSGKMNAEHLLIGSAVVIVAVLIVAVILYLS